MSMPASLKSALARVKYSREYVSHLNRMGGRAAGPVVYTTHKCASTFIDKATGYLASQNEMVLYNYAGLYWNIFGEAVYDEIGKNSGYLFSRNNAVYGPLREYVSVPRVLERSVLLFLRDPRDVLVSEYFSVSSSHALPGGRAARRAYIERRENALAAGIEKYVLENMHIYYKKYAEYADSLLGLNNVSFVTYEELYEDPLGAVRKINRGLGFPETNENCERYLMELYNSGAPSGEERVSNHRRKGAPGDFREKLSNSCIQQVDELFSDLYNRFSRWGRA